MEREKGESIRERERGILMRPEGGWKGEGLEREAKVVRRNQEEKEEKRKKGVESRG